MKGVAVFLIVVMFWAVGLLAFTARIDHSTPAKEPEPAQGIVVLTGAATARLTAGMKLLEQGKGRRLLVSGVNRQVTRKELMAVSKGTKGLYDCCVQLGFQAADTRGNARETAAWVKALGLKSVIVVTTDYHMPRAMLEMRGAMPDVAFTPYPIKTSEVDARRWWRTGKGARHMIVEYTKYLAIFARETFLGLGPDKPAAKPQGKPA